MLVFGGMALPLLAFLIVIAVVLIKNGAGGLAVIPFLFMIPAGIMLAFTIKKAFRNIENGYGFASVPNGANAQQDAFRQQEAARQQQETLRQQQEMMRQHQEAVRQHQEFTDQAVRQSEQFNQQVVDQMNQQTINQTMHGL